MISNIKSTQYPIGLSLPIVNGSSGYFEQTFDTNTQVKNNLINFLKTRRGERRMMPEFGTQLYSFLFEQKTDNLSDILKNVIKDEILYWIPEVSLEEISITDSKNDEVGDNYKLRISIRYLVNQTKDVNTLSFDLENIKI